MVRRITVLAILFCVFLYEKRITEGCHAGHSQKEEEDEDYDDDEEGLITVGDTDTTVLQRSKRQIQQHGDDFTVLRAYFRDCMLDKVNVQWEWKSIIDFTILKTLWFLYSGTVACKEENGKDNSVCWNECVDVYLRNTSYLIKPAKECVRQYESDFYVGKELYTSTFQKTEKVDPPVQGKYQQCVQSQYNEVDPESVYVDTGRRSFPAETQLNMNSVVRFIRGHVRCVICDFSELPSGVRKPDFKENYEINGQELVDGPVIYNSTWPFAFEALVRRDARLRFAISFCNREYEGTMRKDPPPNAGWTQWYTWGSCSAVCGSPGIQTRSRVCLDEEERNCNGNNLEQRACRNKNCAYWSVWGSYTQCLSTCGVSEQHSFRNCVNGKFSDEGCQGLRMRTRSCAIGSCEVPWSQWSACSVTCGSGGIQYRSGGESLLRMRTDQRLCSSPKCPEQWSTWSPWCRCSKSCGIGGRTERVRKCISRTCTGESKEFNKCNNQPCKEGWGQWTPWSDCVFRQRTRVCYGGSNCPGESTTYQRCQTSDCATTQLATPPRWSEWTQWSNCDSSCGPGQHWRSRHCLRAKLFMGTDCVGEDIEWEHCSNRPCHYPRHVVCRDQYMWRDICRQKDCNGEIGKKYCKRSCGYC